MIYTYDCTHPDCGGTVDLFRAVADRDLPASCPCSQSHETKRREVYLTTTVWHTSGATRGALKPGWAEKINADYRKTQIKETMEKLA